MFTARRGFLPNEDLPWADEYRQRLAEIHICALECYAAVALGVGGSELAPGERTARELVKLAPYREHGHALLMEILTARGNKAEALPHLRTTPPTPPRRARRHTGTRTPPTPTTPTPALNRTDGKITNVVACSRDLLSRQRDNRPR
jgi:hypothetical protein